MTTTNINIVIVDQTKKIDPTLLHNAALALNQQVTQDLPQYWSGISANVSSAPSVGSLPTNAWPVFLVKSLPPGEGGFHMDKHNQPYAKVIGTPDDPTWTIDASHEIIEMLVDPNGNRMQTSQAITIQGDNVVDAAGTFDYLVEACDPCEANNFAYEIQGIALSDFITPNFYDSTARSGVRYSFMGNIIRPRQLLKGGYISYIGSDGKWNQILWVDPTKPPQYNNNLEVAAGARSWRESVHAAMGKDVTQAKFAQRHKPDGLAPTVRERLHEYHTRNREKYGEALLSHRGWKLESAD
jgi:hypothetical protein